MYYYRLIKTRIGIVAYVSRGNKLIKLSLPPFHISQIHAFAEKNKITVSEDPKLLDNFADDLVRYFSGEPVTFKQEVNLDSLTAFTNTVLKTATKIPYGKTISYRQLAEKINRPKAFRAVARALSINPIPILIPCHRIICTNGSLGGFSAASGVAFKSELLQMESRNSH